MLLTRILREQWGFDGLVMSDWGAVYRRPAGVAAGLDLEMPSSGGINDRLIVEAVKNGRLKEEVLDRAVERAVRPGAAPGAGPCAAAQKGVSRARAQCGGGAPHAGQAPRAGRARRAGERRAAEERRPRAAAGAGREGGGRRRAGGQALPVSGRGLQPHQRPRQAGFPARAGARRLQRRRVCARL